MHKNAIYIVLSLIVLTLTGCGTHYSRYEYVPLEPKTYLDKKKTYPCGIEVTKVSIDDGLLNLLVKSRYCTPEYVAEKYKRVEHYGTGPNILLLPLVPFMLLDGHDYGIFGTSHTRENIYLRNHKRTKNSQVEKRNIPYKLINSNLKLTIVTQPEGQIIHKFIPINKETNAKSVLSYPIHTYLEKLEEQPRTVKLTLDLFYADQTASFNDTMNEQTIANLHLQNPVWEAKAKERRIQALPVTEQKKIYKQELVKALKNKDYPTAIKNFERFENLNIELPVSFQYHYAKVLLAVGEKQKAKERFEKYLASTGTSGRYSQKAQTQLQNLSH